jgi:hypothetical protein
MAAHKKRNGSLIVSWSCKQGEHGKACDEFLREADNVIVCHCDCHPACQRPECLRPRVQRRRVRDICPECYTQRSLSGSCDC